LIEAPGVDILIDYWRGDFKPAPGKKLYVLASHSHGDHYSKKIWDFDGEDTTYALSYEIKHANEDNVLFLTKGDSLTDENIYVKACGSTDAGISFLIRADEKVIFHAGDLNNWHWSDESTPEEIKEAGDWYLAELEYIANFARKIDVAFFPVDPRLGDDYCLGASQFIERIDTLHFVPMHFGNDYARANMFDEYATARGVNFIKIKSPGVICEII